MNRHVVIIGGGFSGAMLAVNLLRRGPTRVTLIERSGEAGRGLAYGAAHDDHVLNVRAGNMSALVDQPDDFLTWLGDNGQPDTSASFAQRLVFGRYLRDRLAAAMAAAGGRFAIVHGDAVDVVRHGTGATVTLADGRTIAGDDAVLAIGNLPPSDPPGFRGLSSDRYKPDPWDRSVPQGLDSDDTVLMIGTGLTMVDIALLLDTSGFRGRMIALSRRGLLPQRHAEPAAWDRRAASPRLTLSTLLRDVRERGTAIGWRNAVDELRPFTQAMWADADDAARARFLRHLRPWWDVHRHRLAPHVADRLAGLRDSGRLEVVAGKTLAVAERRDGVAVRWRRRGSAGEETLVAQRVINCTGPQSDLTRIGEPLLAALHRRGDLRPDPERIGIDVDAQARTIAGDGTPNDWLYAVGPMTRGAFWEIVAVPDIRQQVHDLASRLS